MAAALTPASGMCPGVSSPCRRQVRSTSDAQGSHVLPAVAGPQQDTNIVTIPRWRPHIGDLISGILDPGQLVIGGWSFL